MQKLTIAVRSFGVRLDADLCAAPTESGEISITGCVMGVDRRGTITSDDARRLANALNMAATEAELAQAAKYG